MKSRADGRVLEIATALPIERGLDSTRVVVADGGVLWGNSMALSIERDVGITPNGRRVCGTIGNHCGPVHRERRQ